MSFQKTTVQSYTLYLYSLLSRQRVGQDSCARLAARPVKHAVKHANPGSRGLHDGPESTHTARVDACRTCRTCRCHTWLNGRFLTSHILYANAVLAQQQPAAAAAAVCWINNMFFAIPPFAAPSLRAAPMCRPWPSASASGPQPLIST